MKLSDKKVHWMEEENWDEDFNPISFKRNYGFKIDDVKQFIKEILEEIENRVAFLEPIDKEMFYKIIKQKIGELE